ncbi:MAG TPA: EamA family transporter [Thermomicrobiales bacterium]|nr:EamA family transporter [Thermomicrobiales bacterium]
MPPIALALVLTAAALHATWNLLVKRAAQKQVFTWWALIVGTLCFAPFLVAGPALPVHAWPYIAASAVAEAAYYYLLTRAYTQADFSLVYPLARGAAPALLAIWAALFLGERPSGAGLAGLALLVGGLLVVGSGAGGGTGKGLLAALRGPGIVSALGVALCISIYSTIDGAAVRFVPPAPYLVLVMGLTTALVTPLVLTRYGGRAAAAEWRANWPRIVAVGVLTLLTYLLVLRAYSIAPVNYAAAIRETSIVFAALIGWRWLGEGFGARRTAGAALIVAGIVTIAVLG